jgi:endonuclease/exonuclease/phosphatase family metal-dependent hydrolase
MRFKTLLYSLLKLLLSLVQLAFLVAVVFFLYTIYQDFVPKQVTSLTVKAPQRASAAAHGTTFSFITWNTGYGGLGAGMDFFYDGGSRTRPQKKEHKKYTRGINAFLQKNDTVDFFLLQEIDKHSRRSYYYRQDSAVRAVLSRHHAVFSKNYDVPFVPLPLFDPLGRVEAGMMTLSKRNPQQALRLALPQLHNWPVKYFMLDRAAVVTKHPLEDQKALVVINIHNSAYVEDAKALQEEIAVIKAYASEEVAKGNHVIAGGDWNQNPPGFSSREAEDVISLAYQLKDTAMGHRWQWAYDSITPTKRSLAEPYSGSNKQTSIDFFALSPGIQVESVRVLPLDFKYSDHEPVYLRVKLPTPKKNRR